MVISKIQQSSVLSKMQDLENFAEDNKKDLAHIYGRCAVGQLLRHILLMRLGEVENRDEEKGQNLHREAGCSVKDTIGHHCRIG